MGPAVKIYCEDTEIPVSAFRSPVRFSVVFQAVIRLPSGEYFSIRPVFAYATNTEPSAAVATEDGGEEGTL